MSAEAPSDPTGLQDVLDFIADFELEGDDVGDASDEWMSPPPTELHSNTNKLQETELDALFPISGRPATTTAAEPMAIASRSAFQSPGVVRTTQTTASASQRAIASKGTRRHRVTRKEELEYLRKKVKDMEANLEQLRERSESDGDSPAPEAPSSPEAQLAALHHEQSVALWRTMAERQKSQRDLVESENAKLREKLKTQVRMARSLQRILRKRERAAEQVTGESPKRQMQISHEVTSAEASRPFDELLRSLDALFVGTDERFSSAPMASAANPLIREQELKYDDLTGVFLEFQNSKLLPFDMETVSRVTWRFTQEKGIKFNKYFDEHFETQDDTVLRKFGVEIENNDRVANIRGRQAIRRYVQADRLVIVRHSIIDQVELSGAATGGITFRETGWIVVKAAPEQLLGTGPATLYQSYATLTPDIDLDSHWEVGTLTDFVLESRGEIEIGNDSIVENLLLEEAAKQTVDA
ncbi:hypothetical protein BBJ28_00001141 [Nothophytophthora sp. Chile5]|nr:hypothetical protein BBJ28_00001141 [Nothophytophthora sp. Chile5]